MPKMTEDIAENPPDRWLWLHRLAWLPIPLLLLATVMLGKLHIEASHELPFLQAVFNFVFSTLVSFFVVYLVGRGFLACRAPGLLFLGCGALAWGMSGFVGSVAARLVAPFGQVEPNLIVTIHNCGIWLSSLLHFSGALFSHHRGRSWKWATGCLAGAYCTVFGSVMAIALAAVNGWTPLFFVPGQGSTPIRLVVIVTSIMMFGMTAVMMRRTEDNASLSPFREWYSLGLALIVVGLLGILMQRQLGDALNWTGRISQYLGGVYILMAALASIRETGGWTLSLEEALTEARQQYVQLFQLAADGIVVHELRDDGSLGLVIETNSALCSLLGYPMDQLRKVSLVDLLTDDCRASFASDTRNIVDDGAVRHEQVLLGRDGRRIPVEIHSTTFSRGGRRMMISVVRDMTERTRIEKSLAEHAEMLRLFIEHAPAAVAMFDREMRYIHASRRWLTDYGLGDVILTGRSHYEIFPEIPDRWKEIHRRCLAGATERCSEEAFRRMDGTVDWVKWEVLPWRDDAGTIGGIIITSESINERKRAEEALKHANETLERQVQERTAELVEQSRLLEAFFKHAGSPLVFLDREFNFIRVNEAYARACNRDMDDFEGHNHFEDYPSFELKMEWTKAVETGKPYHVSARPFEFPDHPEWGTTYWDLSLHPILDERKGVDFLVLSLRDVTERILSEQALREKDALLLQQNRLAAMGEMLNNIAHQWRQPLNVLGLTIQRLPLFYDAGHFSRDFLDESVKEVMLLIQHMSGTIDDFRDFFKPNREKVQFKVADVVDNAVNLVAAAFKNRQIRIERQYLDDPLIYGYPNEYAQVFLNLLSNAKDAFEERERPDARVVISLRSEGGRSVVTVTDNAGGISEDILLKVFEPHFTTKGPKGTGIGLFMAKNIIERNMNGSLCVRNSGEGAEFRIEV